MPLENELHEGERFSLGMLLKAVDFKFWMNLGFFSIILQLNSQYLSFCIAYHIKFYIIQWNIDRNVSLASWKLKVTLNLLAGRRLYIRSIHKIYLEYKLIPWLCTESICSLDYTRKIWSAINRTIFITCLFPFLFQFVMTMNSGVAMENAFRGMINVMV